MSDFKRYANMFYSYRSVTVWSPPECLKQQKKRLDPNWQMDVYSFGMIMWEVLHEKVPFEGELKTAIDYVVEEDARPLILTMDQTHDMQRTMSIPEDRLDALLLTEDLANIIRRCWQTDPNERMKLSKVARMLLEQKRVLFDHSIIGLEESHEQFRHQNSDDSS